MQSLNERSDRTHFLDWHLQTPAVMPHRYKDACAWILADVAEGHLPAAIDTEIIQEVLYRYGAPERWQLAATMASSLLDLVPIIYSVTPADMKEAIRLFGHYAPQGVTARDVVHAAVMANRSLTEIISTNAHFDQIEGIRRIDPLTICENRPQL